MSARPTDVYSATFPWPARVPVAGDGRRAIQRVLMRVALVALKFNHDIESARADAMTIRRNLKTPVTLPEWEATRCVRPEDSPAAYAMKETSGHQLTLRGKFRLADGP